MTDTGYDPMNPAPCVECGHGLPDHMDCPPVPVPIGCFRRGCDCRQYHGEAENDYMKRATK